MRGWEVCDVMCYQLEFSIHCLALVLHWCAVHLEQYIYILR